MSTTFRLSSEPSHCISLRGPHRPCNSARTRRASGGPRSGGRCAGSRDPNVGGAMKRAIRVAVALLTASWSGCGAERRSQFSLIPASSDRYGERPDHGLVAILTVLSVAPGLLIMVTLHAIPRRALVLLRSLPRLQSAPGNSSPVCRYSSFFVMAAAFENRAWQNGLKPIMDNHISHAGRRSRSGRARSGN